MPQTSSPWPQTKKSLCKLAATASTTSATWAAENPVSHEFKCRPWDDQDILAREGELVALAAGLPGEAPDSVGALLQALAPLELRPGSNPSSFTTRTRAKLEAP